MKVVVAIDSFKGSISSVEAGNAVKEAVLKLVENAEVVISPLADGGEGTVDAMSGTNGAKIHEVSVCGPMGQPQTAKYCILEDNTAVMEMAEAAGITLVSQDCRDPMLATTYGVGEMIKDAIKKGCRNFIVGIGGSATNDGGVGMLSALGFEFLDKKGNPIVLGAKGLKDLDIIKTDNVLKELADCSFKIACDVANPLCGPQGCSSVYGPQKGATSEDIEQMDLWLSNFALKAKTVFESADMEAAGAGAAGGLGFAFMVFLGGKLQSGIDLIIEQTRLEEKLRDADVVVTGEGRLDSQTVMGKAPIGVAKLAKKYGKKVIAFSGCVTEEAEVCNEHGIDAFFPIMRTVVTLQEALEKENAYKNLVATALQAFRLLML